MPRPMQPGVTRGRFNSLPLTNSRAIIWCTALAGVALVLTWGAQVAGAGGAAVAFVNNWIIPRTLARIRFWLGFLPLQQDLRGLNFLQSPALFHE